MIGAMETVLDRLLREAKGHTREFARANDLELKLGEAIAAAKGTAEELLRARSIIADMQRNAGEEREKAALRIGDLERVSSELRRKLDQRDKLGSDLLEAARGLLAISKTSQVAERLREAIKPIDADTEIFDQVPF